MNAPFRWGILAPGKIARSFAAAVAGTHGATVAAVGSRSLERAREFSAALKSAPRAYGSYRELVEDPEVDAVYVASPHPAHHEHVLLCIEAAKPVLCEKPFAVNHAQAAEMAQAARRAGVFCMEAMWTRFLPMMGRVRDWVRAGRIGEVRMVKADFSFRADWNPGHRLLDPALAGGGLLDVGVYTLAFASWIMEARPRRVCGFAHIGRTGVDEQAGILLSWPGGELAVLTCGVRTALRHTAEVAGSEGRILIPHPFWSGTRAELHVGDAVVESFDQPHLVNGYEYEALEVMRALREGRTESAIMPLAETLELAAVMDELRSQWGLRYPFER